MEYRRRKWKRLRGRELLEPRFFLSAVAFLPRDTIDSFGDYATHVQGTDVDSDGDVDVVAEFGSGGVRWYENTDGLGKFMFRGTFWSEGRLITASRSVADGDIDGDGDVDLFTSLSSVLFLYENSDGRGTFERRSETIPVRDSSWIGTADVDGDGDIDLAVVEKGADLGFPGTHTGAIVWYENTDGLGTYGPRQVIVPDSGWEYASLSSAVLTDLDGDRDVDVIPQAFSFVLTPSTGPLVWYENTQDGGTFADPQTISTEPRCFVSSVASDIDGDGNRDIVSSKGVWGAEGMFTFQIVWYANLDGGGTFGLSNAINSFGRWNSNWIGPFVAAEDLDGDGDPDVLAATAEGYNALAWYENTDGQGGFGAEQLIATDVAARSVFASDLDGDGDPDLLLAHDNQITWYENRLIGDANDDGVFDSSDMVKVFVAGKYEDGIPDNATFDEGDWNQDGDFDSSDMVMAFQTGLFEAKSEMNANEIAAAVDWLFADDQRADRRRAYVA